MSVTTKLNTQVAIFGGGVAGLWLLNRLRQAAIDCVLIENNQLGAGQTIYAQGIIHSGLKYALRGKMTVAAQAMQHMPTLWRQCLQGQGEINLSQVTLLSAHQYLWSAGSLSTNLAAFLASKNLKSQVKRLKPAAYPEAFAMPDFKGVVYQMEEPVLAVKTLLSALVAPHQECVLHAQLERVESFSSGSHLALHLRDLEKEIIINAERVVLLAGKGNAQLACQFGLTRPQMQLRPLLMTTVTLPELPSLFAHAMQVSDKPRLTITSHAEGDHYVWYLGGDLAETGVNRTPQQQIIFAQQELKCLFPQLDFCHAKFNTFYIERAEAFYPSHKKPEGPSIVIEKNIITAWPTKLAFAPLLAQQIIEQLLPVFTPTLGSMRKVCKTALPGITPLTIADYPWSYYAKKNVE